MTSAWKARNGTWASPGSELGTRSPGGRLGACPGARPPYLPGAVRWPGPLSTSGCSRCSFNGVPLPFTEAVAALIRKGRGRWEARSLWDDRVRATGVSHQDVIRATIEAVWH